MGEQAILMDPQAGDNDKILEPGEPREVPLMPPDPLTRPLPHPEEPIPSTPTQPTRRQPAVPERVAS